MQEEVRVFVVLGSSALASRCLTLMQTIEEGGSRRREGRKVVAGWTRGSLGRQPMPLAIDEEHAMPYSCGDCCEELTSKMIEHPICI